MFGIGGWEFILIAVLALLLFGPDKLPQFARTLGRFMRDFKRYQDLMESTIRAEVFANDTEVKKDQFATGKEFRERVGGGGFRRQPASAAPAQADEAEGEDAEATADETAEATTETAGEQTDVTAAQPAEPSETLSDVAADDEDELEGEGERDEA